MNARTSAVGRLLRDSLYVVDETAVAEAMIMRARARWVVPEVSFRSEARPVVRSFRRDANARSFKLARSRERVLQH